MTTDLDQQEPSLADDLAANLAYDAEDESLEVATDDEPEGTDEAAVAEAVQEAIEALDPPPKWDKKYKDVFQGWTAATDDGNPLYPNGREWQEAMLELYNNGQSYTTKVEQERAEERKRREQFEGYLNQINGVIQPHQQFLNEAGMTPDQAMRQGLGLLQSLKTDPQATLLRLARESNVDLQSALSEQPWQSPESKQIQELERRLAEMQQTDVQRQQRQAHERMVQIQAENARQIQTFAEATDESGNPLHPHLDQVQETMAQLIYGRENLRRVNPSMPTMGLDEAYEAACKLAPEVAQASQQARESERLAKAGADAKKVKEAAKRVKTGSAGTEQVEESLRDTIRKSMVAA